MPKHAVPHARRPPRLKVLATLTAAVLFVFFGVLFVGGTTGVLGSGGDGGSRHGIDATDATDATDGGSPAGSVTATGLAATEAPLVTAAPYPVVTGVAPQVVADSHRLERSLAWLRRGLADATTFRVGTFNVLGASHTAVGGNHRGFTSGYTRMGWAWSMISQVGLSVVGLQELEEIQYDRLMELSGWTAYPGRTLDRGSIRDSIAWDDEVWELVEARDIAIPYFGGQMIRRPVVRLKNIESGRDIWFFNTHNPATTPRWGNNARWRAAAIALEVALANELSADGTPVVFTGDFNDRDQAFCPLVGGSDLEAANGGSHDGTSCVVPDRPDVDWIFGSGLQWTGFASASSGVVGRVSDHPFVYAEATVPEEPLVGQGPGPAGNESGTEGTGQSQSSGSESVEPTESPSPTASVLPFPSVRTTR